MSLELALVGAHQEQQGWLSGKQAIVRLSVHSSIHYWDGYRHSSYGTSKEGSCFPVLTCTQHCVRGAGSALVRVRKGLGGTELAPSLSTRNTPP